MIQCVIRGQNWLDVTYLTLLVGALANDVDQSVLVGAEALHRLTQGVRISNRIEALHWHNRRITLKRSISIRPKLNHCHFDARTTAAQL